MCVSLTFTPKSQVFQTLFTPFWLTPFDSDWSAKPRENNLWWCSHNKCYGGIWWMHGLICWLIIFYHIFTYFPMINSAFPKWAISWCARNGGQRCHGWSWTIPSGKQAWQVYVPTFERNIMEHQFICWCSWNFHLAVCQNLVPLVNIKIAGKWMFIPLKMVLIGFDPFPSARFGFSVGPLLLDVCVPCALTLFLLAIVSPDPKSRPASRAIHASHGAMKGSSSPSHSSHSSRCSGAIWPGALPQHKCRV